MEIQINTIINVIVISSVLVHSQSIPIFYDHDLTDALNNNTNQLNFPSIKLFCNTDNDCEKNSWCNGYVCECKAGWLTWYTNQSCSYKQLSKSSACVISFFTGGVGADWFFLSRHNVLYILVGFAKVLIFIASCIWNRLAAMTATQTSLTMASCFATCLPVISFFWWLTDWIRIFFNYFPDGNGAPLI